MTAYRQRDLASMLSGALKNMPFVVITGSERQGAWRKSGKNNHYVKESCKGRGEDKPLLRVLCGWILTIPFG
jgi:hypothetical protein